MTDYRQIINDLSPQERLALKAFCSEVNDCLVLTNHDFISIQDLPPRLLPRPEKKEDFSESRLSQEHEAFLQRNRFVVFLQTNKIIERHDREGGRITEAEYDKKRKELQERQSEITSKLGSLQKADEDYYLTATYILKLANRASEIFEGSEPEAKRQILKILLQNCVVNDATLVPQIRSPFSLLAKGASRHKWLPREGSPHVSLRDCRQNTPNCELANLRLADQPCGEEAK